MGRIMQDNLEIASAVLPLFAGQDGMEVMSCEVTENKLYLLYESTYKRYFTHSLFTRTFTTPFP